MAKHRRNILVLNGPNLNMTPARPGDAPGVGAFAALARACEEYGAEINLSVDVRQSNHEGEMITLLQEALENAEGVIINAGAYAHTSIALHDALKMLAVPVIEVSLDNNARREGFRQHSHVAAAATGTIAGFGAQGYMLALDAMRAVLEEEA